MELRRVVVTGLGAITPIGKSIPEYWDFLKNGVSGAGPITRFNPEKFKTQFACEVKNYDPLNYFDKREINRLDMFNQFALISAEEAVKNARLEESNIDKDRVGVIWGSGIGGIETMTQEIKSYVRDGEIPRFSPFFIPKMIIDIAPGQISMKYGYKGPNFATVSACASASNAIIDAYNYIRLGLADVFVTGGSEAPVNEASFAGFNAMKALSTRNDDPKTASRPFDVDRDGFVMGEGAGAIILEEYEHAKRRGAHIYCELAGAGLTADAHHLTAPHPEGDGAARVMKAALRDANLSTDTIDYINVHGTSTPLGDIAETMAIKTVFGDHAYKLSVSSTKSMTGHLLGAAGAVEAIASVLALTHNIVPPTINLKNLDPKIDSKMDFTANVAKQKAVNIAISNTFGFGGHNASIIFKKL